MDPLLSMVCLRPSSVSYVHARWLRRRNVSRPPTKRPFDPAVGPWPHLCFVVAPTASHAPVVPIRKSCEHACTYDASRAPHARDHASYGVEQSHLARALRSTRTCDRCRSVLGATRRGACSTSRVVLCSVRRCSDKACSRVTEDAGVGGWTHVLAPRRGRVRVVWLGRGGCPNASSVGFGGTSVWGFGVWEEHDPNDKVPWGDPTCDPNDFVPSRKGTCGGPRRRWERHNQP